MVHHLPELKEQGIPYLIPGIPVTCRVDNTEKYTTRSKVHKFIFLLYIENLFHSPSWCLLKIVMLIKSFRWHVNFISHFLWSVKIGLYSLTSDLWSLFNIFFQLYFRFWLKPPLKLNLTDLSHDDNYHSVILKLCKCMSHHSALVWFLLWWFCHFKLLLGTAVVLACSSDRDMFRFFVLRLSIYWWV